MSEKYLHLLYFSRRMLFYKHLDRKVLCLGLIQSLFEGAMYMFVLEWTPALTSGKREIIKKDKRQIYAFKNGFLM